MSFIGTSISTSPTVALSAGAEIKDGAMKCVKVADGKTILCDTVGEQVHGILAAQTPTVLMAGEDATVQITAIGKAVCGGVVAIGDALTTDASGKVVKAESGNYIAGYALTAGGGAGKVIDIQIQKGGKF